MKAMKAMKTQKAMKTLKSRTPEYRKAWYRKNREKLLEKGRGDKKYVPTSGKRQRIRTYVLRNIVKRMSDTYVHSVAILLKLFDYL